MVPDDQCGLCRAEGLTTAVADLKRRPPRSTLAVWTLRELGCTPQMIFRIREEVKSGRSVDEVAAVVEQVLGKVGNKDLGHPGVAQQVEHRERRGALITEVAGSNPAAGRCPKESSVLGKRGGV